MKYFIDTEFIEGFNKPILGKRRHFIDLISICIISGDNRIYSSISNEYSFEDADDWVKENVINKLYEECRNNFNKKEQWQFKNNNFHHFFGKNNNVITTDVLKFIDEGITKEDSEVEFYGYYSDYDWVLFCSLFGRMMDLPPTFPMYCKDLKQMIDEKAADLKIDAPLKDKIDKIISHPKYPKNLNEHNVVSDTKWNKDLFDFLKNLDGDTCI